MIGNLPADWTADPTGAKGPCPLCPGDGRRAWVRSYSGRWCAGCESCDATSQELLDALVGTGAVLPAAPIGAPAEDAPVDLEACNWAARLPAVERGAGRRYLDGRGLSPVPEVRWANAAALATSPRADWLFPTRSTGTGRDWRHVAAPWGFDRTAVDGALEVCGVELEAVTADGCRIDFIDKRSRRPIKRVTLYDTYPTRGAFVARSLGSLAARVSIVEGGPDGLMIAQHLPPGEAVLSCHGAGAMIGMLPWCRIGGVRRKVTIWAHLEPAGLIGAYTLAAALWSRGQYVWVSVPLADAPGDDWADAGPDAIMWALEREGMHDG